MAAVDGQRLDLAGADVERILHHADGRRRLDACAYDERHTARDAAEVKKVHVNCVNKDKGPEVMKVCSNGCIGCKMCEKTCKFDAIHVVDGVAKIDYDKCKNCKMCTKACPKGCIEPVPTEEEKAKFKEMQAKQAAAAKAKAEAVKQAAEAKAAEDK